MEKYGFFPIFVWYEPLLLSATSATPLFSSPLYHAFTISVTLQEQVPLFCIDRVAELCGSYDGRLLLVTFFPLHFSVTLCTPVWKVFPAPIFSVFSFSTYSLASRTLTFGLPSPAKLPIWVNATHLFACRSRDSL